MFQRAISWFFSEAGAGWIIGIASTIWAIYLYRKRSLPTKVRCEELGRLSAVEIFPPISAKIRIFYNDAKISLLQILRIRISNIGTDTLKDGLISIKFHGNTKLIDYLCRPTNKDAVEVKSSFPDELTFKIIYLNSFKVHGDYIDFNIVLDGSADDLQIKGGGVGWSIEHVRSDFTSGKFRREMTIRTALFSALTFPATFVYGNYIEKAYGISGSELSLRALVHALPLIAFITLFGITMHYPLVKKFFNDRK